MDSDEPAGTGLLQLSAEGYKLSVLCIIEQIVFYICTICLGSISGNAHTSRVRAAHPKERCMDGLHGGSNPL